MAAGPAMLYNCARRSQVLLALSWSMWWIIVSGTPAMRVETAADSSRVRCCNSHQENIISLNSLLMPLISLNMLN
jgi:hypothetical protein